MEVNLKNLRRDMKETVLRDVRFDEEQMDRIRKRVGKQNRPLFYNQFKVRFNALLSSVVCMFLILGVLYYVVQKSGFITQQFPQGSKASAHLARFSHQGLNEGSVKSGYTKKEVKDKMLHGMDHIKSVAGTMAAENYRTNKGYTIQYQVRTGTHPASRYVLTSSGGKVLDKAVSNPKYMLEIWPSDKSYAKQKTHPSHTGHPPVGNSDMSLFPQKLAKKFLAEKQYWSILKQHEKLMNRNVILIGGTFDQYHTIKLQGKSFKFWVDRQTGILLKMMVYDKNGNLVFGFQTKHLKMNPSIPNSIFQMKPPKGFKKTS